MRLSSILSKVLVSIAFMLSTYLSLGYIIKGINQPILVGQFGEYHFWGFYILGIIFSCISFVLLILLFIILLLRGKKEYLNLFFNATYKKNF